MLITILVLGGIIPFSTLKTAVLIRSFQIDINISIAILL